MREGFPSNDPQELSILVFVFISEHLRAAIFLVVAQFKGFSSLTSEKQQLSNERRRQD